MTAHHQKGFIMDRHRRSSLGLFGRFSVLFMGGLLAMPLWGAAPEDEARLRLQAKQLRTQGNWKDALEIFRSLAENSNSNPQKVSEDLSEAIQCLAQLGRMGESDDLIRKSVDAHPANARLLNQAALSLQGLPHYGMVSGNKFERAPNNGSSGVWVEVQELDRSQALRWMERALQLVLKDQSSVADVGVFYSSIASTILAHRHQSLAWMLQSKTDLEKEFNYADIDGNTNTYASRFAPVDLENNPILYAKPKSWEDAANDGERLRWVVDEWSKSNPFVARSLWANFLNEQFGVQTLANDRWFLRFQSSLNEDATKNSQSAIYSVHTLDDSEALARLASGVKRFKLTDEFNPIRIFQELNASHPGNPSAYQQLFAIYTNRRQYSKAVELCRARLARFPEERNLKENLNSIIQPRCRFDQVDTQPAGTAASFGMVYRNAKHAKFTAHRVDLEKLLTDVKQFYRSIRPDGKPSFGGVKNQYPPDIRFPQQLFSKLKLDAYIESQQAEWTLDLQPPENHWERRVNVATPLQQAGLYVITATLARTLVWIQDTAIVRKQLDNKVLYHVADARTGNPLANANVEFFGFAQVYSPEGRPQPFKIANFSKKTNAEGQIVLDAGELPTDHQWQITVHGDNKRFATLGMEHHWFSQFYKQTLSQLKAYGIADRPAYRPGETVKAKFWVGNAQYGFDKANAGITAPQAGQTYQARLVDPQGANLWTGTFETDQFGGAPIKVLIPKDAKLGLYRFLVNDGNIQTDLAIRIEEYRKPEYEVFIDAPTDPVQLGEVFKAKVRAKYYFGTPVSGAKASIKVTRSAFQDQYYPIRPYDWCYGPGYWWISYDAPWYPGWTRWCGCIRPYPWWFPTRNEEQPELVFEKDLILDENGEASIEIDSKLAQAFQSDSDHRYRIEVDVRDASRRTQSASGQVVAARQAFKIYGWNNRGYYHTGNKIVANFQARTLSGKSVAAKGKLELLRIAYDAKRTPIETLVDSWDVVTDADGQLQHSLEAGRAGQYRLKLTLTDDAKHTIDGGQLITIRGDGASGNDFRFSAIELVPDKSEYKVGEKVRLQINADRDDALVALFIRPQNGLYPAPRMIRLQAKSSVVEIPIEAVDQPNLFVEAYTIYDGKFHQETREIFVPPEDRVLDVEVKTNKPDYQPGEEAEITIDVKLPSTLSEGEVKKDETKSEVVYSSVLAVYDRSLEQIAPDAIPPDIREFFWKWRRSHQPQSQENLSLKTWQIAIEKMPSAHPLGIFGHSMADDFAIEEGSAFGFGGGGFGDRRMLRKSQSMLGGAVDDLVFDRAVPMATAAAPAKESDGMVQKFQSSVANKAEGEATPNGAGKPPSIRKDFADAAYWRADLRTDATGKSVAKFKMPENLTSWQIAVWSVSDGLRVGSARIQATTRKNLMVRLQTPRFLVDRDQVVVSALVNNEFDDAIDVEVEFEQTGDHLEIMDRDQIKQTISIPAHGQKRVDWKCRAIKTGEATLRVTAISARESDAMQLKLPVIVNGILKTESFAGTVRPNQNSSQISFTVPEARIVDQSKLTIRVSPSLAMSMIDALPFMVDYPHGCTEQTLNRFVPTVVTHRTLQRMGIDLESLRNERINLNAQELGDPAKRAERWKRQDRNPVFDNQEVTKMVEVGLRRLTEMQNSDGGWGWFSGYGEHSWPHTTAVVVRGLLVAKQADAAMVPDCLQRGIEWLDRYQAEQLTLLRNAATKTKPYKTQPDDLDSLVFHILVMADKSSPDMQGILYEKRNLLSVHSKALLALATHKLGTAEQTEMLRQNIEQFLVEDAENETAYLRNEASWWYWYGGSIEATALYLKLLTQVDPKGITAPRVVKYLLNNRKHATYWNSTRDTAQVIEAFADYLAVSGEGSSDMEVDMLLDGISIGKVNFTPKTLFTANNTIELVGADIKAGKHSLELRRSGKGPLYWNVYQSNFTLEDEIAPAGLEIKVDRRYYRLDAVKKDLLMAGDRGQIGEGKRAAFDRTPITDLTELKSGQLVEIELLVESKNDYEYLMIQDPKAASMEPIETASGYRYEQGLGVYREYRDQYVGFFIRSLPRGDHSLRYRMRCEAPGRYTALPATAVGMYAPELVGNSADFDVAIVDD
jgi:alpha-2-macroglobulin